MHVTVVYLFSTVNRYPWEEYTITGHVESFQLEAMMNSAAVNFRVPVFWCKCVCISVRVELLDYKICEISVLISATSFGKYLYALHFYQQWIPIVTCPSTFVICFFHFIHSGKCVTILHLWFTFALPWWQWHWAFHSVYWPFVYPLLWSIILVFLYQMDHLLIDFSLFSGYELCEF